MGKPGSDEPQDPKKSEDKKLAGPGTATEILTDEKKIIDAIAEKAEGVPDPLVTSTEQQPKPDELGTEPQSPKSPPPVTIDPELAVLTAKAIVQSIDTSQARVCKMIAKTPGVDFHFEDADKKGLIDAWIPVCRKWGDKVPVEIIALFTTVSVLGANIGYAIEVRKSGAAKQ